MKLFLTDYASYNEGIQFKHGHWVDLDQFSDKDEFDEYIKNHFEKIGIEDPEVMFTDYEDFPKFLYSESYDSDTIEKLFRYKELGIENWDTNDWLQAHSEYCSENNPDDEIFSFDEDFFETFFADKPMEAARAASFGDLNWSHEYIRFNGYGNLESTDNPMEWIDESEILDSVLA